MSRAFIKEDGPEQPEDIPEKPISAHPNYVTRRGLRLLEVEEKRLVAEFAALPPGKSDEKIRARKLRLERDLRYVRARLETAIPVDPAPGVLEIRFGARVVLRGDDGRERALRIVGEDEASEGGEFAPWPAPFVSAMIGLRAGQDFVWENPGAERWTVVSVAYREDVR